MVLQSFSPLLLPLEGAMKVTTADRPIRGQSRAHALVDAWPQSDGACHGCRRDLSASSKYEKGKNRISASRLQQMSKVLRVPIAFFFEHQRNNGKASEVVVNAPNQIDALLATRDGLALVRAFTWIKERKLLTKPWWGCAELLFRNIKAVKRPNASTSGVRGGGRDQGYVSASCLSAGVIRGPAFCL